MVEKTYSMILISLDICSNARGGCETAKAVSTEGWSYTLF